MQVIFTRSNSLLSRLIRSVTGETVSHCAIATGPWVVHSNLLGVHVELALHFLQHSECVYYVEFPDAALMPRVLNTLAQYDQRSYDFGALLYLGLRFLCPWLPRKNLWQTTGMFLCTEWITEVLDGTEDHTITPYQLYLRLRAQQQPENV